MYNINKKKYETDKQQKVHNSYDYVSLVYT